MSKSWFLVAALGLAVAGRASAAPSFFGPTGLLAIPTADVQAQQSWNVHVHASKNITTFGGSFGVTKGLEVGVSGVKPKHGDTQAVFNAKYALLMESGKMPGIAIGGVDLADELGLDVGGYVVVSKSLSSLLGGEMLKYNLRGHVGYGFNSFFNDKLFAGVDLQVTQNVQAMVELLGSNLYYGARVGVGQGIRAELGSYDGEIGGGVSYAASLK